VIVEDNKHFLRNIRVLLEGETGVAVIGAFGSAEATLEALPLLSADIMLLDLGLPGMPGIELIAQAKKLQPDLAILVYTAQTDRDILISTLKAGASGYILKGSKPGELIEALHSLHGGGAALSPQITNTVVREFHGALDNSSHVLSFREHYSLITDTKAKIYLGSDDNFTVSDSGAILYGGAGTDTVTIAAGISGVSLDQNIERINFSGAANSYSFKQTGNKINIYDAAGNSLLASIPVQGDTDGTVFGFNNGTTSAFLSGGVITLGGAPVSINSATPLTPTLK
jgi:two-component system NarL family response regulator